MVDSPCEPHWWLCQENSGFVSNGRTKLSRNCTVPLEAHLRGHPALVGFQAASLA